MYEQYTWNIYVGISVSVYVCLRETRSCMHPPTPPYKVGWSDFLTVQCLLFGAPGRGSAGAGGNVGGVGCIELAHVCLKIHVKYDTHAHANICNSFIRDMTQWKYMSNIEYMSNTIESCHVWMNYICSHVCECMHVCVWDTCMRVCVCLHDIADSYVTRLIYTWHELSLRYTCLYCGTCSLAHLTSCICNVARLYRIWRNYISEYVLSDTILLICHTSKFCSAWHDLASLKRAVSSFSLCHTDFCSWHTHTHKHTRKWHYVCLCTCVCVSNMWHDPFVCDVTLLPYRIFTWHAHTHTQISSQICDMNHSYVTWLFFHSPWHAHTRANKHKNTREWCCMCLSVHVGVSNISHEPCIYDETLLPYVIFMCNAHAHTQINTSTLMGDIGCVCLYVYTCDINHSYVMWLFFYTNFSNEWVVSHMSYVMYLFVYDMTQGKWMRIFQWSITT